VRTVLYRATVLTLLAVLVGVVLYRGWVPAARESVRGRVLCGGKPAAGGLIVFSPDPDRGGRGPVAHALIGADGSYELPHGPTDGLGAGWYRVAVAGPVSAADGPQVAERYRYPERSGLAAEVRSGGENVFEFQVEE
jgi:hypothetical protein